jgi:glucosylceramidase
VAASAVDDDASTRHSTGTGQAPGQYLHVDFGRPEPVREIVFDTGVNLSDDPRGYTVSVSSDGTSWSTAIATGTGTGQVTVVPLSGAPVRFVRMTLTGSSGNWWSVADIRAYVAGGR